MLGPESKVEPVHVRSKPCIAGGIASSPETPKRWKFLNAYGKTIIAKKKTPHETWQKIKKSLDFSRSDHMDIALSMLMSSSESEQSDNSFMLDNNVWINAK
ncbi:hypothetical protein MSG28_004936 [Choristoneura fumiferana]|uniref:Uncharacterized protein n=1 Tax=Choristoneura fumiferana TaxID=7141 RepID=A0ACC0JPB9_CHOFU|nr:hypothetical protein MSG28_004936 [Choristoneura fumiferana]